MHGLLLISRLAALAATALALAMFAPSEAIACPDCATALAVRASVFDGSFWTNLALILLPLAVLALIGALLHKIDAKEVKT